MDRGEGGGDAIPGDGRNETENERFDRNWNDILQEFRVTQTGTQILGGFLLALAFQPRFTQLDGYQLALYLFLVAVAALGTACGLAAVVLHRSYFGQLRKEHTVAVGGRLLIANLVASAVLTIGVVGLIFDVVLGRGAGLCSMLIAAVILAVLWLLIPRLGKKPGSRRIPSARS